MRPDTMIFFLPIIALFIPIVAIIIGYFERKAKMQVIEKAIEKGISPDNLNIERAKPRMPYRSGMVTLAVGLGLVVFGVLVGQKDQDALLPLVGIASILILIGAALLLNDKINHSKYFDKDNQ